jgi:hypothetical protein
MLYSELDNKSLPPPLDILGKPWRIDRAYAPNSFGLDVVRRHWVAPERLRALVLPIKFGSPAPREVPRYTWLGA